MMNTYSYCKAFLSVGLCTAFLALTPGTPVAAQNVVQTTSEMASPAMSDPRTRAKLHTELGALYLQDGNMAVALEELKIAINADSSYAPAYGVRGLVRMYLREMPAAEADFKQALNLAENDPEINNNYGWFLCQNGREKDSIAYFLRAIKDPLYQTPERAYLNAGTCSRKFDDLVAAEDFFQKALRFSPNNPQALMQLAHINYRRGNLEVARQQVSDVLRKVEPNAELLWLAVRIEHHLGERSTEASYSSQLRRKFPTSPEYQSLLKGNFE